MTNTTQSGYKGSYLGNLLLCVVSAMLTLLIAEGVFRTGRAIKDYQKGRHMVRLAADTNIGYELKPGFNFKWVSVNRFGFRGKEPQERGDIDTRLVVIGDSIAFGPGLPVEDIFPYILEKNLNKAGAGKRYEVINAAVGGYDIWQYHSTYESKVRPLKPDIVLVSVCQNDFTAAGPYYTDMFGLVRGAFTDEVVKNRSKWLGWSKLYGFISLRMKGALTSADNKDGEDLAKKSAPSLADRWEEGKRAIESLVSRIKADGATPVFVIFPYKFQLAEHTSDSEPLLTRLLSSMGTPLIDMLDSFRKHGGKLYMEHDYIHPNPDGHSFTADIIAERVAEITTNRKL